MSQIGFPLLSLMIWLPALGAALLLLLGRSAGSMLSIAFIASLGSLVCAGVMVALFSPALATPQLIDVLTWVPAWGLSYYVAVDGISLWLVVLTTIMMPFAILAASEGAQRERAGQYALLLLLETGILGAFLARDLILFYVFFEATLIPTAIMLVLFGGPERRRAATKFFLYTFAGSVFMLLSIIAVALAYAKQIGSMTFSYDMLLASFGSTAGSSIAMDVWTSRLLFFGFLIAFAVKIALWPFHTWMPFLHEQTPADGSVDVGAVLLKVLGGYGMLRFALGLFPAAAQWAAPAVAVLAVIGIIYGAWLAYGQRDMKMVLAFSSVSHLAFVVLGIFSLNTQGMSGAVLQLVNYGLTTGALFLAVAALEQRYGTRQIRELGGLWAAMPVFGGILLALVLASIGLPGLNGFVGEFMVLQGSWLSVALGWRFTMVAVLGVILAAAYLLRMYKETFMGPLPGRLDGASELNRTQLMPLVVLLILMLVIGLFPNLLFGPMQPSIEQLAQALNAVLASQ